MRTRKVIALSLLTGGAALLFSGCPSNPPSICTIARTSQGPNGALAGFGFAVHYYYVPNTDSGDCSALDAGADFSGALFTEAYGGSPAVDPTIANGGFYTTAIVPEEFGWTNPYTQMYVQGSPLSPGDAGGQPISFGQFTSYRQDTNGECTIAQTDAGTQLINGTQVTYSFAKVLVYNDPYAGEGTQIQADVQITRGNCTRSYVALGLWPIALCNVDNDCNPNAQPGANPPRPIGSGLLPGFNYACAGAGSSQSLTAIDPIQVPANVNQVPNVTCLLGGAGDDSCVNVVAPSTAAAANTVCDNTVAAITNPPVACTVNAANGDSCDPDPTNPNYTACVSCSGGSCSQVTPPSDGSTATGSCGTLTGACAYPILDIYAAFGCPSPAPYPYLGLVLGCGGAAKDNNGTNGSNVCFFANPSATTFPYTNTPGK